MKTLTDDIGDNINENPNNSDDDKDKHADDKFDVDSNLVKDNSLINKTHSMDKGQAKQMLLLQQQQQQQQPSPSSTYPPGIQSQPKQLSSLHTTIKG